MAVRADGAAARIMAAFEELLRETDYDKITVADICRRAGVSRKTLYTYFEGKEGVLRRIVYEDVAVPVRTLMDYFSIGGRTSGGKILVRQILETIYTHKDFYSLAVVQGRIGIIGQVLRDVFTTASIDLFRGEEGDCSEKFLYAARFTSGAYVEVIKEWLRSGMTISPEEMTEWLFEFSSSGNKILLDPLQ